MVILKAPKSTLFNRVVKVPLILILWICIYPFYALGILISGFFILLWFEVIREVIIEGMCAWKEYTNTIGDGIRFITGRIKNK